MFNETLDRPPGSPPRSRLGAGPWLQGGFLGGKKKPYSCDIEPRLGKKLNESKKMIFKINVKGKLKEKNNMQQL